MSDLPVLNLKGWIEDNRDLLRPPVGNKVVWSDNEFLVMVVGGPNKRKDYHVEEGDEFFYQVEGDIVVRIMVDGAPKDVEIKEGEMFLLPARIPHSPQRPADTAGLVIERQRKEGELDSLRWYCDNCLHIIHEASFQLVDLGKQLKPVIEEFYATESLRTCEKCGTVMDVPAAAK